MEQQKQVFKALDVEREAAYARLGQALDAFQNAERGVRALSEKEARFDIAEPTFDQYRKVHDDLEAAAGVMRANFSCWRSAWSQFVRTREKGKALRAELVDSPEY